MNVTHQCRSFFPESCQAFGFRRIGDAVRAYVDYRGAFADVIAGDHCWAAHGGYYYIGTAGGCWKIAGFGVTDSYCRVGVHQQQGYRLSYDIAASDYRGFGAFDGDIAAAQDFHYA